MKTILLIGLGRFGRHVAMKLHELNHQVMAVDQDEEKVNRILPYVTSAQIGDSTNEEFLASLGVRNFDVCIVAIGDNFQSSLETASLLKEAGAKKVVARAARDIQAKFRCETGRTRSSTQSGRSRSGPPSDTARIIFRTISRWGTIMPSLRFRFRITGSARPSASWMSGNGIM